MEMELPYTLADRYRLVSYLAQGGMSDVYLAVDLALGRRVAVKILPRSHSEDQQFVRRFRREAQAAANLNHSNIVGIYDWGEAEGAYYMVMELVEGDCLRDITREKRPIPPRRAADIARQVASALAVAHRLGVIHRDVKPGNIMLTPEGAVKVADFGIARAWDQTTQLTEAGAVIGTATYFSPEQAQGEPADIRSDIYSLGVVLYEMLVGRPPFQGETPMAVAYQHVSSEVTPPSSRNSDVPPELDFIVLRALAKNPDRRYQDAESFLRDLDAWLRGEEIPGVASRKPQPSSQPASAPAPVVVRRPVSASRAPTQPPRGKVVPQGYYPHMQERRPVPLPFVFGVLVLLAALAGLTWVVLNLLQAPGPEPEAVRVVIPDVAGRLEADALASIQESGLIVRVVRQSDDELPEGRVISTDPPPGARVESRTVVQVVVSSGAQRLDVPLVIGQTQGTAESLILAQGFLVGSVEFLENTDRQVGTVVDQEPLPGPLLPAGTLIDLVVASGPGLVVVPDVAGLPSSEALSVLAQSGLRWIETVETSETVPAGQVVRTEPGGGGGIAATDQVVVVISAGSETDVGTGDLLVPDVAGMSSGEALVVLAQAGLRWAEATEVSDTVPLGKVIRTEPPAGESVEAGGQVVLVISEGAESEVPGGTVPDVVGLSGEEAFAVLTDAGLSWAEATEVSDTVPLGEVIRTEPPAGESVEAGGQVVVVVISTSGETEVDPDVPDSVVDPDIVVIPDVAGLSSSEAFALLANESLSWVEVTEASDVIAAGGVIRTEPGPGDRVQAGSQVVVVISQGPADSR